MSKLIKEAYKKHQDWINIVKSFGCSENITEDIVQEMYIYLIRYDREGKNIWHENGEINYYYIFKQLRGIYVDYLRQNSKIKKVSIEDYQFIYEELNLEYEKQYAEDLKDYEEIIEEIYWYDKKVFELIARGKSIAELSRETNIGYWRLYNTYNKVKDKLKKELL